MYKCFKMLKQCNQDRVNISFSVVSSASANDKPRKGQNRGRGKRKRSQNSNRSMRRLALGCSSSSSCSSIANSQVKSPGGDQPTLQTRPTLYGGTLRKMRRCPATPSKMAGKRYCLGSQPADLALTLAEVPAHKPYLGDETPGPSKRFGLLIKEEERPTKRRKSGRSQRSCDQPESTKTSDAVRPAKAPRKGSHAENVIILTRNITDERLLVVQKTDRFIIHTKC